jgi:glucose-1-phosphate thymidylyltransferase
MNETNITGIIPAAGYAKRLSTIPSSKELLTIGLNDDPKKLRILSEHLIETFRQGAIEKAFFIIREGKWDIPQYYQNGSQHGLHLGYLIRSMPFGVPFTIYEALEFFPDDTIAMGFPDILFEPKDAFLQLRRAYEREKTDMMIGLFQVEDKSQWDMVEVDENWNVNRIEIKPESSFLQYAWCISIWNTSFSKYLKDFVLDGLKKDPYGRIKDPKGHYREPIFSDVINGALNIGIKVKGLAFQKGTCLDLGSYENLFKIFGKQ